MRSAAKRLHDVFILERLLRLAFEDDLAAVDRVEPVPNPARPTRGRPGPARRQQLHQELSGFRQFYFSASASLRTASFSTASSRALSSAFSAFAASTVSFI